MNTNLPNGGFPPIKNCNKQTDNNKKISKDRYFSTNIKNINIRKILNSNVKQVIVLDDDKKTDNNDIEEV